MACPFGEAGADIVHGGAGNDVLLGGEAGDKLYGEAEADILLGGMGADELYGGDGADVLAGEDGHDVLLGVLSDQMHRVWLPRCSRLREAAVIAFSSKHKVERGDRALLVSPLWPNKR